MTTSIPPKEYGQEILKITGGGISKVFVWSGDVTISPDGRWFTTIGADGAAGIWDIQTGKQLFDLVGHEGRIWDVAVNANGTRLATLLAMIKQSESGIPIPARFC